MDRYQDNDKCCQFEINITEVDRSYVCTKFGKVQNIVCFGNEWNPNLESEINSNVKEFCHRLHIYKTSQIIANELYNTALLEHPSLRKSIILATAIYIATKRNGVPRTLK